jgi:hypothetical protein
VTDAEPLTQHVGKWFSIRAGNPWRTICSDFFNDYSSRESRRYFVDEPNILSNMKQGRKTASEKRKEAAKPRNHPRSKPEKISIKRPEPDQEKNPVPDSKDGGRQSK